MGRTTEETPSPTLDTVCEKLPNFQKSQYFASEGPAVRFFKSSLVIFMAGDLGDRQFYWSMTLLKHRKKS